MLKSAQNRNPKKLEQNLRKRLLLRDLEINLNSIQQKIDTLKLEYIDTNAPSKFNHMNDIVLNSDKYTNLEKKSAYILMILAYSNIQLKDLTISKEIINEIKSIFAQKIYRLYQIRSPTELSDLSDYFDRISIKDASLTLTLNLQNVEQIINNLQSKDIKANCSSKFYQMKDIVSPMQYNKLEMLGGYILMLRSYTLMLRSYMWVELGLGKRQINKATNAFIKKVTSLYKAKDLIIHHNNDSICDYLLEGKKVYEAFTETISIIESFDKKEDSWKANGMETSEKIFHYFNNSFISKYKNRELLGLILAIMKTYTTFPFEENRVTLETIVLSNSQITDAVQSFIKAVERDHRIEVQHKENTTIDNVSIFMEFLYTKIIISEKSTDDLSSSLSDLSVNTESAQEKYSQFADV